MGCDIHAYVEYTDFITHDGKPYWKSIVNGAGGRNYKLFGLLAGVRSDNEPVIPLKGLPDAPMSYEVEGAMFLRVTDDPELAEESGYATLENAEQWGVTEVDDDGKPKWCEHPDMHSHGWLTRDELAQVLGTYIVNTDDYGPYGVEWDAILAVMTCFTERNIETRLVFAFDN